MSRLTGETKTEAIRKARLARPERLRSEVIEEFLRDLHDLLAAQPRRKKSWALARRGSDGSG